MHRNVSIFKLNLIEKHSEWNIHSITWSIKIFRRLSAIFIILFFHHANGISSAAFDFVVGFVYLVLNCFFFMILLKKYVNMGRCDSWHRINKWSGFSSNTKSPAICFTLLFLIVKGKKVATATKTILNSIIIDLSSIVFRFRWNPNENIMKPADEMAST